MAALAGGGDLSEPADPGAAFEHLAAAAAAYGTDRFDDARLHLEAAFAILRSAGELRLAARIGADIAEMHMSAFGNSSAAKGWLERTRRVLERIGPCVEWGYWELAFVACDRADITKLLASAERALLLAAEHADPNLEARALADSGFALVASGRTEEGFARLDAAMAGVSAGEVTDAVVAGKSFCALMSSCDRAGDVARAEDWTRLVAQVMDERFGAGMPILTTHCLVAHGAVLSAAGRWSEAEEVLARALGPAGSRSVSHRVDALARLAELRVEQGRVDEAAELLGPYEDRLAVAVPLARVHLARGDAALAAAVARRAITAARGDALRAGMLSMLLVEAELARGEPARAAKAAATLAQLAGACDSTVLAAQAAYATGRVLAARGDHEAAAAAFDEVIGGLQEGERPLLAGQARLALGEVHAAAGDVAAALTEARAALALFERTGAVSLADRAAALARQLGSPSRHRRASGATALAGLTAREQEVLDLVRHGATNAQIGSRLFLSPKTVEHHLSRLMAKLGVRTRTEAAAIAAAAGTDQGV